MTLGIDVYGQLPFFQQQAESIMTDTVQITREGQPVWNESEGKYEPVTTNVYSGRARVRDSSSQGARVDDVNADTTVLNLIISLPLHEGADVNIGDIAEVMDTVTNPRVVGNKYRLMEPVESTYASSRRFLVQRYVSKE